MIFSKQTYFIYSAILLACIVFSYFYLDIPIAKYFLANKETYQELGDFLSIFGQSHWYIGGAILGWAFYKFYKPNELYKQRFLFLLYANLFSGLISVVLKPLLGKIRPWGIREDWDLFGFLLFKNFEHGFMEKMSIHINALAGNSTKFASFPSGHTTTVFAAATFFSILFPRYIWLWMSTALVFALARLLSNDHFLSDIFAGILLGTIATMFIYSKMKDKINA